MSDQNISPSISPEGSVTFLEKFVNMRILILFMCLIFYIDIWLLNGVVNIEAMSIEAFMDYIKKTPISNALIFFLSFSLMMGVTFPVVRLVLLKILAEFFSICLPVGTNESKKFSDWSFAFVCLSLYDLIKGGFSENYRGLIIYLIDILNGRGFEVFVLVISMFGLWALCFFMIFQND